MEPMTSRRGTTGEASPILTLALAGDTMLGRGVADRLADDPSTPLLSEEVVAVAAEADLFLLNLECAISERGTPWPDPAKPFFFRAPPVAAELLCGLGVGCVTLANNHALDYGPVALVDTLHHLSSAGIAWVGAGADLERARRPVVLERGGLRIGVLGLTDHPPTFAAGLDRPGVAYADLARGVPSWVGNAVSELDADIVVATPHWGPNMVTEPVPHVLSAAASLRDAGATLVAGHSAHVFHGVGPGVLYDLGDFIDDYATDARLRNDLGLLFLVTFEDGRPLRLEAVPLALDYCQTRLAEREEAAWVTRRFRHACAGFGTEVTEHAGRLVVEWDTEPDHHGSRGRVPDDPADRRAGSGPSSLARGDRREDG